MYYVYEHYFITFIIKECMFVCESSSGEGPLWGGSPWCCFFIDSLYLDSIKSSLTASSVSCLCSGHVFTPTFFKISSFVFNRRKKLIQFWNNMRASQWWQFSVFWWTIPLRNGLIHRRQGACY